MKKNDKGERGFGFGTLDAEARAFLKPDFDRKRQVGQKAVGMYATADDPQVVDNAQVEGSDC